MIKTAVVILNWNGEAMLRQFLPSVIACSCLEGTEIYVADNASTDASCEVVEKEFPSVHLIRLDKNYGFADGYNYALQKIDAEYAVLLNSDVEVTEGWLQPMVDYLDTHPETVACQPSFCHLNITVKQDSVFRVYFLQSIVVAIGKTIILIQAYQVDRRKFFFYHLTRSIRGSIVGYINFRSLQTRTSNH
jgi:GT2 family glycosyltransferase